jgi:hypothetical protein
VVIQYLLLFENPATTSPIVKAPKTASEAQSHFKITVFGTISPYPSVVKVTVEK